ncbi:MAG: hypothetical protein ACJ741_01545 [Pyrinomonadaceae bacterium]
MRVSECRGACLLSVLASLLVFLPACARGSFANFTSANDGSALVGNWIGESICVGDHPACHDEKVIYRIKQPPDAAGNVEISADKIVDGKPENMGVIRCKYDGEKKTLTGDLESPRYKGVWEFAVRGDTIEGTLTVLPEKTVARRIKVKKEAAR